jgi:predicted DNA-binding protein YlxM (UPF0122 family)
MMATNLPALREADPKTILQRYLSDESTKEIAETYGVTRQALGQYLMQVAEEDWKIAQVARAQAKKEQSDDVYDQALKDLEKVGTDRDARELSLARVKIAEAQRKAAQWDLERVCRRIYGQDVTPDQLGRVSITLNIGGQPLDVVADIPKTLPSQE